MATLMDLWNQRSKAEKEKIQRIINHKVESCEMFYEYLRDKGYSEKRIRWTLERM